ncbi:hypothetical protein DPMN_132679 [Dreissena polymorpha]|uniref:Uncharacterized protein n=1 Tax=Dreissena polymorpha TaxID=45954 RepID=A0A9D4JCA1_DREPO|nr:hypothetical protein DPMN_132679 [Dreissena polymorpha]
MDGGGKAAKKKRVQKPQEVSGNAVTQASQVVTPTTVTIGSDIVEMEVSVASAKRKVDDEDDFTPMPRNRVFSGNIPVADKSLFRHVGNAHTGFHL